MKAAILASLARARNGNDDPVFGPPRKLNRSERGRLQRAYFRFKNPPGEVNSVLIRPYKKTSGKPLYSLRQSRAAEMLFSTDREEFARQYRLIARLQKTDKPISKALNYYLTQMLEGNIPGRDPESPYLSDHCHAYRRTTGVPGALDSLEQWAYEEGFEWIARTDIKSYFDEIDRDIVHDQLITLFRHYNVQSQHVIDWLTALAGAPKEMKWRVLSGSERGANRRKDFAPGVHVDNDYGIPQGNPISAPLSNLYLNDVDHEMVDTADDDYRYLRYADDIVICAKSKAIADQALDRLRALLDPLHLVLGEDKTFTDHILSGNISYLGFRYRQGQRGKEIAHEKVHKFRRKIIHLTSAQHIDEIRQGGEEDLIQRLIHAVNVRILVTRDTSSDADAPQLSPRSFPVHYGHNKEPAIFRQMAKLDSFIRWRVARCLTRDDISNARCQREFFNRILPASNERARNTGRRPVKLIPLTGVFNNIPAIRRAGTYGVQD